MILYLDVEELWIAFGSGQHLIYIHAHSIALSLGSEKSQALSSFHGLTGCDTVSSFAIWGKKSAWETWNTYGELTDALLTLIKSPSVVAEDTIAVIERFIILLYNRISLKTDINEARKELFVKKGCGMEDIPPTKGALVHHIRRTVYQGAHCWGNTLEL